ncbi:MAG: RCC1 domain-containing protein [Longimicrobiales bacterium]
MRLSAVLPGVLLTLLAACGELTDPGPAPIALALGAGTFHACSLTEDGSLRCWGRNDLGQLARHPAEESCELQGLVFGCSTSPAPSAQPGPFTTITLGDFHACALDTEGAAYCWGSNNVGQLGADATDDCGSPFRSGTCSPAPIRAAAPLRFDHIDAGPFHTCGIATDGATYCWGNNSRGQLGVPRDSGLTRTRPARVQGDQRFVSLALGTIHSCAIDTQGQAYCWGSNLDGRLGTQVDTLCNFVQCSSVPVPVDAAVRFSAIAAGDAHTCALSTDQHAFCWGVNLLGQSGIGSWPHADRPTEVIGGFRFSHITAGDQHTCAVNTAARVYCWGFDLTDQLGTGIDHFIDVVDYPFPVDSDLDFVSIAAGVDFTCAATADGELRCWGADWAGQLGNGPAGDRPTP